MEGYKKILFVGIVIIVLGVIISIDVNRPLGTIFVAIGGLFFISGMHKKRLAEENHNEDDESI